MKRILGTTIFLFSALTAFAQSSASNGTEGQVEEIELPDVTTVVDGKTFTAGKDSVPDYSEILPENDSPEIQLPQMDGVKSANNSVDISERASQKEKDIYAQGELGAGYPFYFKFIGLPAILHLKLILITKARKASPAKSQTKDSLSAQLLFTESNHFITKMCNIRLKPNTK